MSKSKEPVVQATEAAAPDPSADPQSKILHHRIVVPIQTRGNLGKSTEAIARCEWMNARGVRWRGYDLDASNRTLSTALPTHVSFVSPSLGGVSFRACALSDGPVGISDAKVAKKDAETSAA